MSEVFSADGSASKPGHVANPVSLYPAPGDEIDPNDLVHPKAIALRDHLMHPSCEYLRLENSRRRDGNDILVLRVEPEVPQYPVADIQPIEIVAVEFDQKDQREPSVSALRKDFPRVIHTNVGFADRPVGLCLDERPYVEQQLSWTAAKFARRLHYWLSKTARGELHGADQALEGVFLGSGYQLVLPRDCLYPTNSNEARPLAVFPAEWGEENRYLIARQIPTEMSNPPAPKFGLLVLQAPKRMHDAMQVQPRTLDEFLRFLSPDEQAFRQELAERCLVMQRDQKAQIDLPAVLVIRFPKTRVTGGPTESTEMWAFLTDKTARDVGASIGLWPPPTESTKGGVLLQADTTKNGEGIGLCALRPSAMLDRSMGAWCNNSTANQQDHVIIGVGTLGSQVTEQLVRSGYGKHTIIDGDFLLPHNVARHLLTGIDVGRSKAVAVSEHVNLIYDDTAATPLVADAMDLDNENIAKSYREARMVLDMSASVAVSRTIAIDVVSDARRVTAFLSPCGRDSVLLAEPDDRTNRLDTLEMEYFRAVAMEDRLADHLTTNAPSYRYANACRDVTSRLPHDLVINHATTLSHRIRNLPDGYTASIYRSDEDLVTEVTEVSVSDYLEFEAGGWVMLLSNRVVQAIRSDRKRHLPNESGGVLIGAWDTSRRLIYVVEHIEAPPDSIREHDSFMRGCTGLRQRIETISDRTLGQLGYIGEWHSHPSNSSEPSERDRTLFQWLSDHQWSDGLPAVMAIVATNHQRWMIDKIDSHQEVTCG